MKPDECVVIMEARFDISDFDNRVESNHYGTCCKDNDGYYEPPDPNCRACHD